MMNQHKYLSFNSRFLSFLIAVMSIFLLSHCGSVVLQSLDETKREFYDDELNKIKDIIRYNVYNSGKIKAKQMALATVYMKVIFQKDSMLNPEDKNFIKYQPWWNTDDGIWGFTGVAQHVYESLSDDIESRYGRVIGINQNMYKSAKKITKRVKYPVKVPTGGIEKKEGYLKYLTLADVTSYNYGAFNANEGQNIAKASLPEDGGVFFPYFNIFLNKDLATISKLDGELVINYKAFVNGYFMFCNQKVCEQATLPKGQHLTITVPLPPKKALANTKKQESINLFAQKHLSKIMTELALVALDRLKDESEDLKLKK
jgi:hypothetical protein